MMIPVFLLGSCSAYKQIRLKGRTSAYGICVEGEVTLSRVDDGGCQDLMSVEVGPGLFPAVDEDGGIGWCRNEPIEGEYPCEMVYPSDLSQE